MPDPIPERERASAGGSWGTEEDRGHPEDRERHRGRRPEGDPPHADQPPRRRLHQDPRADRGRLDHQPGVAGPNATSEEPRLDRHLGGERRHDGEVVEAGGRLHGRGSLSLEDGLDEPRDQPGRRHHAQRDPGCERPHRQQRIDRRRGLHAAEAGADHGDRGGADRGEQDRRHVGRSGGEGASDRSGTSGRGAGRPSTRPGGRHRPRAGTGRARRTGGRCRPSRRARSAMPARSGARGPGLRAAAERTAARSTPP